MSTSSAKFEGIFCPSITVSDDQGVIDTALWGRHLDRLIQAGINGVLLFGSIGEFYAYDLQEKRSALQFAIDHIRGRMKVFVGIGDTNMDQVMDLTTFAGQIGADAVVAVSPYYFGPSEPTAYRYFTSIAHASVVPVILYNFPARTGNDCSPELVARLARECPNIVGIKDTVDTISHTRRIVSAVRGVSSEFSVFSGFDEYYLANRICGGNGVLSGLTNVEPETFVAMHQAYQKGDYQTALDKARRINHLMAIYDTADLFVSAIKGAVRLQGLPISTRIREPATQIDDYQMRQIETILRS